MPPAEPAGLTRGVQCGGDARGQQQEWEGDISQDQHVAIHRWIAADSRRWPRAEHRREADGASCPSAAGSQTSARRG